MTAALPTHRHRHQCARPPALPTVLQGQGHLGLKSAWGMAKAMAAHPGAVGAFMSQLQVVPAAK